MQLRRVHHTLHDTGNCLCTDGMKAAQRPYRGAYCNERTGYRTTQPIFIISCWMGITNTSLFYAHRLHSVPFYVLIHFLRLF